jgi:hypothetical protein
VVIDIGKHFHLSVLAHPMIVGRGFETGSYICIGQSLALTEIETLSRSAWCVSVVAIVWALGCLPSISGLGDMAASSKEFVESTRDG